MENNLKNVYVQVNITNSDVKNCGNKINIPKKDNKIINFIKSVIGIANSIFMLK